MTQHRLLVALLTALILSLATHADAISEYELMALHSGLSGEQTSYCFYLARGLSDSSPDWGVCCRVYFELIERVLQSSISPVKTAKVW
jgi:hypothetical protein